MSKVKDIINSNEDAENREELMSLISRLEADGSKVSELDLESLIYSLIEKEASKAEEEDIKTQVWC